MKIVLAILLTLFLTNLFDPGQQPEQKDSSCGFVVQGEASQSTISGPEDITPLVYVVEQPDSPVEVVSVDLKGTWLAISHEEHTEQHCAKYMVRNWSDRTLQGAEIRLMVSTTSGAGAAGSGTVGSALRPGQTTEVNSCGGSAGVHQTITYVS